MKNKNLFKLPNNIFNANLSASELTVLAAVYSLRSHSIYRGKKVIQITQKSIATICGFKNTATISKAIDKLVILGYIEKVQRFYVDAHKLGAYVYTIPVVLGRYFYVNRNVFKYKLKPAQMRMYLFFCKCAESKSRRFWNSLNDIGTALNLCHSSVCKTISELISVGLIKRFRVLKKDGSYSDNHYEVVAVQPPRRCHFAPSIFKKIKNYLYDINIHYNYVFVNTYFSIFLIRGSPKKSRSLYSTHSYPTEERNVLRLYLKYYNNLMLYN